MILALINKGYGTYGNNGTALSATDFMVFGGTTSGGTSNETDPTVAAHIKNITSTQISQWNSAYGWGNHSGLYRPSSWVPSWSDVTGKPVFTRSITGLVPAPGGSGTDRFLREDGNWAIPSGTGGTGDSTPTHVNQITTTQISNWDSAYGWGNHASVGYTTQTTSDGRYLRKIGGVISSSGIKNWSQAVFGNSIGFSTNGQGSSGFPTEYGMTYSFMLGYTDAESNVASRGRDFDLWKQNNSDRLAYRGYSTSSGNANGWKWLVNSTTINQIWIGTTAQLPSTRYDDVLYFVTD